MTTLQSLTWARQCELSVAWYKKHGKHKDRIKTDPLGRRYVQGDFSWNHTNTFQVEWVNLRIAAFIQFKITGIPA